MWRELVIATPSRQALSLSLLHIQLAPLGPVPAQLEEIVEVREAKSLELRGEVTECGRVMERPNGNQLALHPEFGIGKIVAGIELGAHQTRALERALADQHRGRIGWNRERHDRKLS